MTDKEIWTQLLQLLETIQRHEETHVMHARMTHGRLALLEQRLSLLVDLAEMPEGAERDAGFSAARPLFEPAETQLEVEKLHARIESQHEVLGHLIAQIRTRIESLG